MSHAALFHTYLRHYADKNLDAIAELLTEDVHLRDWNISVFGKTCATATNSTKKCSRMPSFSRQ